MASSMNGGRRQVPLIMAAEHGGEGENGEKGRWGQYGHQGAGGGRWGRRMTNCMLMGVRWPSVTHCFVRVVVIVDKAVVITRHES